MTWKSAGSGLLLLLRKYVSISVRQGYVPVFVLLLNFSSYSQSQLPQTTENNYRAVFWTEKDGLSLSRKNVMLKDINGFLWIISPLGLNRFDGSTFKLYFPDKTSSGKIGGSYTFSLVEDSVHNIWIGTNKGLSRYDIKADTFKNFSPDTVSISTVATVMPFWATRDLIYCLEAGYKIVTYDVRSFRKKVLATLDNTRQDINSINVPNSIYDSASNSVWMLIGGYASPAGGLIQVLLSEKRTIRYQWPCLHKAEPHGYYSYNMQYDKKRNCIWINTLDGLFSFSLRDHHFQAVKGCSDYRPFNSFDIITGLELDLKGHVWFLHNTNGIMIYDPDKHTLSPLMSDPVLQKRVSEGNTAIYADRDGMVWCGYINQTGICQLIPYTSSATRIWIPGLKVTAGTFSPYTNIVLPNDDELWVGNGDGELYSHHLKTGYQ